MRVVVGATKGGTGKTTTAMALAVQLARRDGPTVLVDADVGDERTEGASTWWKQAEADGWLWPAELTLVSWRDPMTVPEIGNVVFDMGPGQRTRMEAALRLSDTAVVPVKAERADVAQVGKTAAIVERIARERSIAWGVLLTQVVLRSREAQEAHDGVLADGFPLLDAVVPFRRDYARMTDTVPEWFGAYADVLDELED